MTTDYPAPEQRVRSFVEQCGHDHIYTLVHDSGTIFVSDLRDVLNELEEHRQILVQIDEALAQGGRDFAVVRRIRSIMGNHAGGDDG